MFLRNGNLWGYVEIKTPKGKRIIEVDHGKAHFNEIKVGDVFVRTMYSKGWIKK